MGVMDAEEQIKHRGFAVAALGPLAVTLMVQHTCGHRKTYYYAGEEFATLAGPSRAADECWTCTNKALVAANRSKDHA